MSPIASLDTIRVPHAPTTDRERAARDAKALRNLKAWGALDLAEMLGLLPTPRQRRVQKNHGAVCEICDKAYVASQPKQRTCSRRCGGLLAARGKAAAATDGDQ